jgi:hypothetical protein
VKAGRGRKFHTVSRSSAQGFQQIAVSALTRRIRKMRGDDALRYCVGAGFFRGWICAAGGGGRLGSVVSLMNLAIWLGIGPVWRKLVGIW